jgi:hypothetical protein
MTQTQCDEVLEMFVPLKKKINMSVVSLQGHDDYGVCLTIDGLSVTINEIDVNILRGKINSLKLIAAFL